LRSTTIANRQGFDTRAPASAGKAYQNGVKTNPNKSNNLRQWLRPIPVALDLYMWLTGSVRGSRLAGADWDSRTDPGNSESTPLGGRRIERYGLGGQDVARCAEIHLPWMFGWRFDGIRQSK
jgi:hypothetical protein